jgi:hypothetical protein
MRKAEYGCENTWIDVTNQILRFSDSKEPFVVKNELFGVDPCRGKKKFLKITTDSGINYALESFPTFFCELAQNPFGDCTSTRVTFIIPSIGRSTLLKTIESLEKMKSTSWQAIIVFDGFMTPPMPIPSTISTLCIPKIGFLNCAGEVRNQGIRQATTEWIAFVDDDDQVTPDYMFRLQQEIESHPQAEVILFRMLQNQRVLPCGAGIRSGDVGISFAMKRSLCDKQGHWFQASASEDFDLLHRLQRAQINIHISPFITYLVR